MPVTGEFDKLTTLKNGMEIAVLPFAKTTRMHLYLFVRGGSVEEFIPQRVHRGKNHGITVTTSWGKGTMEFGFRPGVDHLKEHMVFKGCKKRKFRTLGQITKFFRPLNRDEENAIGAETTELGMCYFFEISPKDFERVLEFLAELTLRPLFTENSRAVQKHMRRELDKERNVVLEEMAYLEDDHLIRATEQVRLLMFPNHPLGHPLGGTEDDISSLTLQEIKTRHRMCYHPSRMLLVIIGGGINPGVAKKATQKYFRAPKRLLPEFDVPPPKISNDVATDERVIFSTQLPKKTYIALGFPIARPATSAEEVIKRWILKRYSIWVLKKVFGGRWASRPFVELREKRGIGYRHNAILEEFPGAGALIYTTHLFPEETKDALRIFLRICKKLATEPIPAKEFEDTKASWMEELDSLAEVPEDIAKFTYLGLRLAGRVFTLAEVKKAILEVTPEDVLKVAKEIIVPKRLRAVFTGKHSDEKTQRSILRMLKNWHLQSPKKTEVPTPQT